ncbi:MAG: hypothetical protein JWL69_5247 [Phycisphaerales bacterium]|nr:hypothetical protein [Phycisphaerales bacterium]MDB5355003.1 hypothetical protein [Phycisphaerales bacterium]
MATVEVGVAFIAKDAAALFQKLGLTPADERPILKGWAEANAAWFRQRAERVVNHSGRVQSHLRRFANGRPAPRPTRRKSRGRRRPVWCVELKLRFRSLTAAADFVNRSPSNIFQALNLGVRCGQFHWEPYDAQRHGHGGSAVQGSRP